MSWERMVQLHRLLLLQTILLAQDAFLLVQAVSGHLSRRNNLQQLQRQSLSRIQDARLCSDCLRSTQYNLSLLLTTTSVFWAVEGWDRKEAEDRSHHPLRLRHLVRDLSFDLDRRSRL